jgi:hypothetical protein
MEAAGSFEIMVPVYHTARRHIPEGCNVKRMVCTNRLVHGTEFYNGNVTSYLPRRYCTFGIGKAFWAMFGWNLI